MRPVRCLLLPPEAAPVCLRLGPEFAEVDARALEPGATLRIEGGAALTTVRLPEDHAIDVALVRPLEAPPLHFLGRIGTLAGRIGTWPLARMHLPGPRRVGRDGYVGPADAAPPEAAVRVCTGPGALLAAARGRRAQARVALGDAEGTRFAPDDRAEPAVLVQIEDCAALAEVDPHARAMETRIAGCPSLRRVDGTGIVATLERCGSGELLEAVGAWKHLVLRDCPPATVRAAAPRIYPQGANGRIVSLHGAELLRDGPPELDATRRIDPVRIATLGSDAAWATDTLDAALADDPTRAEQALRLIERGGFNVAAGLVRLGERLEAGIPVAHLWRARRALAAPYREVRPDPGVDEGARAWHWFLPVDDAHLASWLADLALLEHACRDDAPAVAQEAQAVLSSLPRTRQPSVLRLLAEGRAARTSRGAPTRWIESILGRALDLPEPDALPGDHTRRVLTGELRDHAPALVRLLGEAPPNPTGERWLEAFHRWLHRVGSGEAGLEVLYAAARGGDEGALHLLAEAAFDGGAWSAEERAEAMRRVLGVGG